MFDNIYNRNDNSTDINTDNTRYIDNLFLFLLWWRIASLCNDKTIKTEKGE